MTRSRCVAVAVAVGLLAMTATVLVASPRLAAAGSAPTSHRVYPTSLDYYRPSGGWAELNPAPGVYDWRTLDARIAGLADGQRLGFRIYGARLGPDHRIPQWVIDDGAVLLPTGPLWSDLTYLEHWTTFVQALGARYDGHPDVAWVDLSGYGDYGEWTYDDAQTSQGPVDQYLDPQTADGRARNYLIDMFVAAFPTTQVVMSAQIRSSTIYALTTYPELGWRRDCLGRPDQNDASKFWHPDYGPDLTLTRWQRAPVIWEFCSGAQGTAAEQAVVQEGIDRFHISAVIHNNTHGVAWLPQVLSTIGDRWSVSASASPGCATSPSPLRDISTSFARADIECIHELGLSGGLTPTRYGPGHTVSREQMAAFLARLWRLLGGTCPTAPAPLLDVGGSFARADIDCIYGLGVTGGASPTHYDRAAPVTREQMAAFLARLWRALGGECPAGASSLVDIVASFAKDDIACIQRLGVTGGVSATHYGPALAVTREQMAAFLARLWARALTLGAPPPP